MAPSTESLVRNTTTFPSSPTSAKKRTRARWWALITTTLMLSACSADSTGDEIDLSPTGCAGFEDRGPFGVGVRTLDMGGVPVEVWYPTAPGSMENQTLEQYDMREWLPAEARAKIPTEQTPLWQMHAVRDLAAATDHGPFPVVLFSHGMGGYRMQSSFLMTHLASWGFAVAAPEHPERGLSVLVENGVPSGDDSPAAMRAALELLRAENARVGGALAGVFDLDRVAVTGHSAGGGAVLEVANDEGIGAWMTFASGGFGTATGGPEVPSMMMAGTNDGIAAVNQIESAYDRQAPDKHFVAIDQMGHLGFTDICAIGADRGGVLQIAIDAGIEVPEILRVLGNDGCTEDDLPIEQGWPVVNHYTTAFLMEALGVHVEAHGLADDDTGCFGNLIATYKHD